MSLKSNGNFCFHFQNIFFACFCTNYRSIASLGYNAHMTDVFKNLSLGSWVGGGDGWGREEEWG